MRRICSTPITVYRRVDFHEFQAERTSIEGWLLLRCKEDLCRGHLRFGYSNRQIAFGDHPFCWKLAYLLLEVLLTEESFQLVCSVLISFARKLLHFHQRIVLMLNYKFLLLFNIKNNVSLPLLTVHSGNLSNLPTIDFSSFMPIMKRARHI